MNRRGFLEAIAALGISINIPTIFGSNTSNRNKRFVCDEEQPIKINILSTFDIEQILECENMLSMGTSINY